jgi:sec-independent protein translocase protein TatA
MPSIGPLELIIVLTIVLIVFGPSALPKIMAGVGKGIRDFRDAVRGISADLEDDRPADRDRRPRNTQGERRDEDSGDRRRDERRQDDQDDQRRS